MAWSVDAPSEERTKKFLIDLVRQMRRGFIECRSIKKEVRQSETARVNDRPLVEGMKIEIDFEIFYRAQAVNSS